MQGESFRPNQIEKTVEKTLKNFLEEIKSMDENDFMEAKQSILNELNEFSTSLPHVAEKYFARMEENILEENDQNYTTISNSLTQESLYLFAKEFFVNKPRRITLELFANSISEDESGFNLSSEFTLDQREYELCTIDSLLERKTRVSFPLKS